MSLYHPKPGQPLTPSEAKVYNLVVHYGYSDKEIAKHLCKKVRTVKFHKENIFIKKGVNSSLKLTVLHYQRKDLVA